MKTLSPLESALLNVPISCSGCGNILYYTIQGKEGEEERTIIFVQPCEICKLPKPEAKVYPARQ